jgi:hypothetical protein
MPPHAPHYRFGQRTERAFDYTSGASATAWDSTVLAESHTLRLVPGVRCYPSVASGTFGLHRGIDR